MIDFCGLHVHSDFSLRDGFCRVSSIVKHCYDNNYSACCITDHGTMGGAISLYTECNNLGIKPIIGCEFYVVDDRENQKKAKKEHIVLIAKNLQGFKNLITINNDAVINGFYYKPTTDYDFIYKHSDGIICLTACAGGKASQLAIKNDFNGLCDFLNELKQVFGEDVYTEIMLIDFVYQNKCETLKVSQQDINKRLVEASYRVGVKTVITNDSHYIKKNDVEIHDMVLMLAGNKTMDDKAKGDVWEFEVRDLYYKGVGDIYSDYDTKFTNSFDENVLEDSFDSIEDIINKVEFYKIDDSFKCPKLSKNIDDALSKVTDICVRRLGEIGKINNKVYVERLERELELMYKKNFLDYFLIVKDIIDYAKSIDSLSVGPGRGSCSSSLVCFLMGIVSIDCIKWELPFERFLNWDRSDIVDIDSDFSPEIKDKVRGYILNKYKGKSCSIGTYGKLKFRSTLLDICRVFNIPVNEVFSVTKKLPMDIDDFTFDEAVKEFEFLDYFLKKYNKYDIAKYFKKLYGSIRNISKHAAGIIICDQSIGDQIPLAKSGEHFVSSWSDGNDKELSNLGFLKMDVLGLNAVKILSDCVKLIKKNKKVDLDLDSIDLTCKKTFIQINKLKLCGIFQFETPVSIQQIKKLKPKTIMELSNITAMIRPGPLRMGMDKVYLKNKINGYNSICSEVDNILKSTYGVMLYQEQIMSIVQCIGGFTLGQADTVRRLLIKASKGSIKKAESNIETKKTKNKFIQKASLKIGEREACKIWEQMLSFAAYGFNKAHSIAYTIIAYWESWLKTHYPLEFYCSLLNNVDTFKENKAGNSKIKNIVREMGQANVEVYLPDVNISDSKFSVYNGGIMFGLQNIKGIVKASDILIKNRPYNDLGDLLHKNPKRVVNKKVVEALIGSGSLNNIDGVVGSVTDEVKYLGLNITSDITNNAVNTSLSMYKGTGGKYSGLLLSVEEFKTKKNNDLMCKLIFDEIDENVLVWPSDYVDLKSFLNKMTGKYFDFCIKVFKGDTLIFVK